METRERLSASLSDDGRYRLLVEAITDYAVYMLDRDGTVTSWNPGARRFKGYEASEIIGQHFSRFYTEEDRSSGLPARALEIARRTGKFENEGWRVRKDGSRFWAYVVIDPIRLPSGEVIGFAKITRDLTERKKSEEALKKSEDQFRLLVQGVSDYAIYMLDPAGNVATWNAGARRIKGYAPHEIIGQHVSRKGHHRHAAYLVENAQLRGFAPDEIEFLAALVRHHRRGDIKSSEPRAALLDKAARERLRKLAALLRLADGLDRGRRGVVESVDAQVGADLVLLRLHASDDAELELWGVRRRRDLFEKVFERELEAKVVRRASQRAAAVDF